MTSLNYEQQQVQQAIQAMRGNDRLIVSGRAGSGKTYSIANSIFGRNALFLTPTHPAAAVLEQELQDQRHRVATIHSAIGWYQRRNEALDLIDGYRPAKRGRQPQCLIRNENSMWSKADIVIVDECSMVGSFLFRAIEEYATEFGIPVVYSGDRFQLPPVNDREVITKQGFKSITLNDSVRFSKESEIFIFGEALRQLIETNYHADLPYIRCGRELRVVAGTDWLAELCEGYESGGSLLALTSDNVTLMRLRRAVRGTEHANLAAGDLVRSKKTDEQFRNGEQLTINHIQKDIRVLHEVPRCVSAMRTLTLNGFSATFVGEDRVAFILDNATLQSKLYLKIRSLHEEGTLDRREAIRILDWLELPNSFELTGLATVHKSQGMSVDTVFIDTNTVLRKPAWLTSTDHLRMLYTAFTRARKQIVLYELKGYCDQSQSVVPLVHPQHVCELPTLKTG